MNQQPTKPDEITRTFVNSDKTVQVTLWPNGWADVQTRFDPAWEWSPPLRCHEVKDDE